MQKFDLITRNLTEVIDEKELHDILDERNLKVYWGTAPTGKPHLGYFVPILKIADFLKADCEVTILFADLHAVLEGKSSLDVIEARCQYYEIIIIAMLKQAGASIDKLKFVRGRSFQLEPNYTSDVYRLMTLNTIEQAKRAGSEVVKMEGNPTLGNVVYPLLQCLDEEYLKVDAQFGGLDQRKIFMCARENLPKLGYKKRIHLMNPLIPGLGKTGKMTSSDPLSKIDFDDSDDMIKDKLMHAYSRDGSLSVHLQGRNCLLSLLKYVVFPFLDGSFELLREEKYGGNKIFPNFESLEDEFENGLIGSLDLKLNLIPAIIKIVTPIRELIGKHDELSKMAYS